MEEKEINVQKHKYVPKHAKLTEEEKQKLLGKYNISTNQLPMIFLSDVSIKDLNPQIGDIIKIIRESPTAKESIFYRVVIRG